MNNSQNKNQITYTHAIIANIVYILILLFWLLNGGLKFIDKFISVVFSSPSIFLNLHWGTQWVYNKVLYSVISLVIFSALTFLIWKVNVKVFGKSKND